MAEKMSHGGFESREYPKGRERKRTLRYFRREYSRDAEDYGGGSMLAKMGICAMLCGLVLLSNRLGQEELAISASADAEQQEGSSDYLGKLRFVELPGIIQVFSSGAKLDFGVEHTGYELEEDDTLLCLSGVDGQALSAPAECRVKSVSEGDEGRYAIELSLNGDVSVICGGLTEVKAEEGQPLNSGDTLGTAGEELEIRVHKAGRPQDPLEYLDLGGQL